MGLVTNANLEASRTHKVGAALGLAVGSGGIISLGTTSQQYSQQGKTGLVFSASAEIMHLFGW